jgi:Lon protease-like protein
MPMIVLAECNLLPHALLPLYIFEPRYKAMLKATLNTERFFCVGSVKSINDDGEWDESDDNIYDFSCAGIVRACVGQPDGTARLILQGFRRIRITGWKQREPFRIAHVEDVPGIIENDKKAISLSRQVLEAAKRMLPDHDPTFVEQFEKQFGSLNEPDMLADIIGYNFIAQSADRQPLLGMARVEDRLSYILEKLRTLSTAD